MAISCTVDKSDFIFDDDQFPGDGDGDSNGDRDGDIGDGDGDGSDPGGSSGDGDGDTGDGDTGDGDTGDGDTGDGDTGDGDMSMGGSGGGDPDLMPGDLRCESPTVHQVQVYAGNDIWANIGGPCEFICVDGACTGSCVPGTTQCIGSRDSQYCDGTGTWNDAPTCMYACDPGTGECGGECVPGHQRCNGLQREICDSTGSWNSNGPACTTACSDSGDGASATCTGSCVNDTYQCNGNKELQRCVANEWQFDSTCPNICLNGMCTGECDPYADPVPTRCDPSNRDQAQKCQAPDGVWGTPFACEFTCVAALNDCGGVCRPDDVRCLPNGDIEICDGNGQWELARKCREEGFLQCQVLGAGTGDPQGVCGDCVPGTESNPVNRCHTTDATRVEECYYDESAETTQWIVTDECQYCWQGACYGDTEEICETGAPAIGCVDPMVEWRCGGNGNVKHEPCTEEQGVCEFLMCGDGMSGSVPPGP